MFNCDPDMQGCKRYPKRSLGSKLKDNLLFVVVVIMFILILVGGFL